MVHPSLRDLATSPIVRTTHLYVIRCISMALHLTVLVTGVWTRKLRFFVQWTNWTNMISAVYAVQAWVVSQRYIIPGPSKLATMYQRSRPSHAAHYAEMMLNVAAPMHLLTTCIFWPLLWKHFRRDHGNIDLVYGIGAHGVTLIFVMFELVASRIEFPLCNIKPLFATLSVYSCMGLSFSALFNFSIYPFLDVHQPKNMLMLPIVYALLAIFYGLCMWLVYVRVRVLSVVVRRRVRKLVSAPSLDGFKTKRADSTQIYDALRETYGSRKRGRRRRRSGSVTSIGSLSSTRSSSVEPDATEVKQ
ncbi:hypothetical protein KIPB_002002 [Kipferlia bialata]|uniref:Uncharacterized protein n=1 Tax=Kipferlia bialata TaxID=797122 RepID=A0A9K3CRH0_9EUKA|nr:hypothetical protein KIPB_002002 [Kipferlia bialata]|eukprot:g2002.t1